MAKIIAKHFCGGGAAVVVSFKKGEKLQVNHIVGSTLGDVANVEEGALVFKTNCLVVLEHYAKRAGVCRHARYAREGDGSQLAYAPEGYRWSYPCQGYYLAKLTPWPRFRTALQRAGTPRIHIPGGFEYVLLLKGEIAVPDYSMAGSHGWIVKKGEVKELLDEHNPLTQERINILQERLEELKNNYALELSDAKIRERVGGMLGLYEVSQGVWWVRISVKTKKGVETFGFNRMSSHPEGTMSASAGYYHWVYRPIPVSIQLDHRYDDMYRWTCLFDGRNPYVHDVNSSDDPFSQRIAGFEWALLECMGGEQGDKVLYSRLVFYEQGFEELTKFPPVVKIREEIERIERTLSRQNK